MGGAVRFGGYRSRAQMGILCSHKVDGAMDGVICEERAPEPDVLVGGVRCIKPRRKYAPLPARLVEIKTNADQPRRPRTPIRTQAFKKLVRTALSVLPDDTDPLGVTLGLRKLGPLRRKNRGRNFSR